MEIVFSDVVGSLPVNRDVSLFLDGGIFNLDTEEGETGTYHGTGLDLSVSTRVDLRFEIQRFDEDNELDFMSVGFKYYF